MKDHELLELESRKSFDFFWNETNTDINSKGYGLIRDRAHGVHDSSNSSCNGRLSGQMGCVLCTDICSIASVGFGLSALPIGVERGWISRKEGFERAARTLNTLLHHADQVNGFFYHFLCMKTAKRARKSEVSIIDTAILLCGSIVAGEYFGGSVWETAQLLYERTAWNWYRDDRNNRFYMGYIPEQGFSGWWDFYAEQLMTYILGAGSPTYPVPGNMFYDFACYSTNDDKKGFVYSWFGSLFTHQFSHAWVDFRGKKDLRGVDWWENSVRASLENRAYCIRMSKTFKTLHEKSWGLTPCDGPFGYQGRYGSEPSALLNRMHIVDGTVPPAGAAGSIVFTPNESLEAMEYYYNNHPKLWGRYGFVDAYNVDVLPNWYASDVIGINKGITLLMIENFRTGLIWDLFMKNRWVKKGINAVGLEDYVSKADIA